MEQRPTCRQCGRKLRPSTKSVNRRVETTNVLGQKGFSTETVTAVIPDHFDHDNLFCTYMCGYRYGVVAARRAK